MSDFGLTHIALVVTNIETTVQFYAKYAGMQVVHRRAQRSSPNKYVVWLSDTTRPFVIVLLEEATVPYPLKPFSHLGFACQDIDEFRSKCNLAQQEGIIIDGPHDSGPPVGLWVFLRDPDGHTLELSWGQEVEQTVVQHEQSA